MKNLKEYVTVKRAAAVLGVSIMTLHRWDSNGKMKAKRHPLNGYRLYDEQKIKHLLKKIR
ncbi:MAG: MerR family DNA-binding transcriptional regulator [Candidatus Omnitrophica bacterium]|nr:MerR family DNA-binding transcriptional regulator [Candidatus Omnitrophota bacterium]